jgi:hypothetical protein
VHDGAVELVAGNRPARVHRAAAQRAGR